jgi:hypothetical protein
MNTDDVVDRLRAYGPETRPYDTHLVPYSLASEAADEIERLRRLVRALGLAELTICKGHSE